MINGRMHGKGTHTWPGGGRYIGEWKDNMMHGNGIYTWPDEGRYIGEFESGYLQGKGTRTFPDTAKVYDAVYERNEEVSMTCKSNCQDIPI